MKEFTNITEFIILIFSLEVYHGHTLAGVLQYKCALVDTPLIIECDDWSVIYIRQTMLSDYHDFNSADCFIPSNNPLCHVFSNETDSRFNGQHQARYTYTSKLLASYGQTHGNCNETMTSRVVQIFYECVYEKPSICENKEKFGESEVFLMNPSFPEPVDRAYDHCTCQISASSNGIVKVTAVLINPVIINVPGKWELTMKYGNGEYMSLHTKYSASQSLEIPPVGAVTLEYRSTGSSNYLPVMDQSVAGGFWLRFYAFPQFSRLTVECRGRFETEEAFIPPGIFAVVGCIGLIIMCVIATVICFAMKRNKRKKSGANKYVSSDEISSVGREEMTEIDKSETLERCNTLPSIHIRYNTLPRNFTFPSLKTDREINLATKADIGSSVIRVLSAVSLRDISDDVFDSNIEYTRPGYDRNYDDIEADDSYRSEKHRFEDKESETKSFQTDLDMFYINYCYVTGITDDEIDV